jgi:SHS2 domain-containing protein
VALPSEKQAGFETFTHDADIGVRGYGPTIAAAFEQAALALTSVITDPEKVQDKLGVEISCGAPDNELLLMDWLNAVVYEMATRGMLFSRFRIELRDGRLWGWAFGEPVNVEKHEPAVEVKGATLTALSVTERVDGTWIAQCVVDV